MDEVEKEVLDILYEISGTKKVYRNKDIDLVESGFLDSMGVVELITELEDRLNFEVPLDEFDVSKFNTANKIIAFVHDATALR